MADELVKFKSARKTLRQSVSKLINILESEIKNETFDKNIVEENLFLLNSKQSDLKIINDKILNCFKGNEAEIEKECDSVIEYEEKINLCIFRAQKKLKFSSEIINNKSVSDHTAETKGENKNKIRLPKISIARYYGDPSLFLEFFNSYENAIGNNTELTKVEKFTYLKSLLGGPALSAISGFSLSDENYDESLKLIKERFGRTDLVISSHMNKLLNLEPVKNSGNIKALRTLYDSCEIHIRSLNSLGIVSESYGSLLGPVILKLLPDDMNLEFNRKHNSKGQYNLTELLDFIRLEVESREASNLIINSKKRDTNYVVKQNKSNYSKGMSVPTASALTVVNKPYCFYCNQNTHELVKCEKTDEQKRSILKTHGRCYKCFKKGHVSSRCKVKIPPCELCNSLNHNKLFCKSNVRESETLTEVKQNVVASLSLNSVSKIDKGVYLQTCSVFASDKDNNRCQLIKILIDGGSQKSFIKSDLAKELKLKSLRKESLRIYSFGYTEGRLMEYDVVKVTLKSIHCPNDFITIEALVTDTISGAVIKLPSKNILELLKLENLKLADNGESSEIKILLGSDTCWEVQTGEKKRISKNLFAVSSMFGWSLVGSLGENQSSASMFTIGASRNVKKEENSINDCLKKFWTLDNMGLGENENIDDDKLIIEKFENDLKFSDGRYVARLLWKSHHEKLADNFQNAKQRLMSLINKLKNDEWLKENYDSIINDQLNHEIIEACNLETLDGNTLYYMPHSPVVRRNAIKTKVRIVFDAYSKSNNEISLNDCLVPGPNLNPSVLDLILRFRLYKYAFTADIEKAFLQIGISDIDRNALRFLYIDKDFNLKPYRMTRVPFGVSCSPFILACTIKYHIKKIIEKNPDIYQMLNNSIYVDDLFYGANSVERAFELSVEAHNVLKDAGMNLRQFSTNSEELKILWDGSDKIKSESGENNSLKVLGLNWCNSRDVISLNIDNLCETLNKCREITKRNILKVTATIFDPVGFLAPFVLRAKLIMQNLWQLGLDFDDYVPPECRQLWSEWCGEIETLKKFEIPREYFPGELYQNDDKELHVFCDASIKAYGAVAYFRLIKNGEIAFVMAKSRIAPIKQKLTLPRLELLGALTAAKLAKNLQETFTIHGENIYLWTDSMIVLYWIHSAPERWKLFVKNRVVEIQNLTNPSNWKHCSGKTNPADILSRGCSVEYLLASKLWRSGPDWLTEPMSAWPKNFDSSIKLSHSELEEKKQVNETSVLPSLAENSNTILNIEKYSKLSKVIRITSWVFRFIYNLRNKNEKRKGVLTAEELFAAELHLIKEVQYKHFPDEIKYLKSEQLISKNSKIYELNPFLSDEGVLRLGGRLQRSSLSFHEKHPLIIPSKTHFTDLLVRDAHERVLHTGVGNTLMFLRTKYWIIRSRQNVKRVIRRCVICQRYNSRPMQQAMAPLPSARIKQTNPFDVVGLDYAGPLFVKNEDTKYYILLITCAMTRGIHLELTKDLTTKTFLLAFRRFVSRRGLCSIIYSDNARTFKAADAELKKMWEVLRHPEVKNYYATKGIEWRYIVERGAWWGGFYERLVRTVKTTLRKILGRSSCNPDELETILVEIEAMINHRPLTYVQDESETLTPAHFLLGKEKPMNLPK